MRNSGSDFTPGDQPSFDAVARTNLLLDALATRTEPELGGISDPDDDVLAELLGDWRDDLRWPPASALVSQDEAEEALRTGMMQRPRGRRGLAAVGSVAASLLVLSGFGAVVADAKPGDFLYGLHVMMFDEPRVNDDQIVLSAKADLAKVEQMIAQGQWDQAQTQLAEVSSTLQAVNDGSRKQGLLAEMNQLNTKVEKRDPKATAPAAPPSTQQAVPSALEEASLTPPQAPDPQSAPSVVVPPSELPEATQPTEPAVSPTPITTPPGSGTTTTTQPGTTTTTTTPPTTTTTPPTTTTAPSTTTTTPSTTTTTPPTTTTTPPSPTTSSGSSGSSGQPKPGTSATPGATPTSPVASTPSGELWDRTSGPSGPPAPRTPFPTSTAP